MPAILVLAVSGGSASSVQIEDYRYQERVGEHKTLYTWRLERAEQIRITAREEQALFVNICSSSGRTKHWTMRRGEDKVTAWQSDGTLTIQGEHDGERVHKEVLLGGLPWYQPLSFSLRRFLARGGKDTTFWTIRPDTLEAVRMQAVRCEQETVHLGDRRVRAWKVRISPAGLFSFAWKAHYWFRQSDGLFVQYKGRHGLPGTPLTVVQLAREAPGH